VGDHLLDLAQGELASGDQAQRDRLVVLPDDAHRGRIERERIEGRAHGAVGRVLDGDEGALGVPLGDGADRGEHCRFGERVDRSRADGRPKRVLAEGPGRAEVGDSHGAKLAEVDRGRVQRRRYSKVIG
jgi:hypothetical protein